MIELCVMDSLFGCLLGCFVTLHFHFTSYMIANL